MMSDEIGRRVADGTARVLEVGKEIEENPRFKKFDQRSEEFKDRFDKIGERRILRAYPNLLKDIEDKWQNRWQPRFL